MSEWIRLADKQPEPNTRILARNKYMVREVFVKWNVIRLEFRFGNNNHRILDGVTHWQPLPDPSACEQSE